MKNISHDAVSKQIREQLQLKMRTIYERIKTAFENYDFTTTLTAAVTFELAEGGFVLQVMGGSPKRNGQQGEEYIYGILQNETVRFYFGGSFDRTLDQAVFSMETLPQIFDQISVAKAIDEIYTTHIPNGWTFPLSATVINKI